MSDDLKLIPDLPAPLSLAAKQGTLIPFVGAGASQIGGCPGWEDFATGALRTFLAAKKIDHSQFAQLVSLPARTRLSVAVGMEKEHSTRIAFDELLKAVHDPTRNAQGMRIYGELTRLAKTFITTNYDEYLDLPYDPKSFSVVEEKPNSAAVPKLITRNSYWRKEDFKATLLSQPDTVIHLHGSVRDRDSMVLTTADYLDRYSNHRIGSGAVEENHYINFLNYAFHAKSILFVGYSLGELEILEYVLQKSGLRASSQSDQRRPEPKHHIVQGFFSHELQLMRSLGRYYLEQFNVRLLPYLRDERDWSQLTEVVAHMADQIPVHGVLPTAKWVEMRGLLDDY